MKVIALTKYIGLTKTDEIRHFIKFCVVGLVNTVVHFSVYVVFFDIYNYYYLQANALAWFIAVFVSFFLNKYWTFQNFARRAIYHQYIKFFIISGAGLALNTGLLFIFVDTYKINDKLSLIFAIGIVTFWNFFLNKLWTFKNS
jgi:putative flippase GtrA